MSTFCYSWYTVAWLSTGTTHGKVHSSLLGSALSYLTVQVCRQLTQECLRIWSAVSVWSTQSKHQDAFGHLASLGQEISVMLSDTLLLPHSVLQILQLADRTLYQYGAHLQVNTAVYLYKTWRFRCGKSNVHVQHLIQEYVKMCFDMSDSWPDWLQQKLYWYNTWLWTAVPVKDKCTATFLIAFPHIM
jgi:hypothetical protein